MIYYRFWNDTKVVVNWQSNPLMSPWNVRPLLYWLLSVQSLPWERCFHIWVFIYLEEQSGWVQVDKEGIGHIWDFQCIISTEKFLFNWIVTKCKVWYIFLKYLPLKTANTLQMPFYLLGKKKKRLVALYLKLASVMYFKHTYNALCL